MPIQETKDFMALDPQIVRVLLAGAGFVFVSLVGIIVWLARGLMTKVDTIVQKQDKNAVEIAEIKKDMDYANKYIEKLEHDIDLHTTKLDQHNKELNDLKIEILKKS